MIKIIENSLLNSLNYNDYKKLTTNLLKEKKSTGINQTEEFYKYSLLNDKRIKRLDKTIKLEKSTENFLKKNSFSKQTWLLITESWCGDAAHNLPILYKMSDFSENIDLKIVIRDFNIELIDKFLTNNSRSIPKLISLNENKEILFTWGPRPSIATKLMSDYKKKHGKVDNIIKKDLQLWYNKNKGVNLQQDIIKLMNNK